ncbi:MAG: hypothetical protein AAGN35_26965 [Bacteroidota bacterium]
MPNLQQSQSPGREGSRSVQSEQAEYGREAEQQVERGAQVQLQKMLDASPRVQSMQRLQAMADAASVVQRVDDDEEETETEEISPEEKQAHADLMAAVSDPENDLTPMKLIEEIVAEVARLPIKLGPDSHHIELRAIGEQIVVGIASEFTNATHIRDTLIAAAGEADSEIAGRQGEIRLIYQPVKQANDDVERCQKSLTRVQKKVTEEKKKVQNLGGILPNELKKKYEPKKSKLRRSKRLKWKEERANPTKHKRSYSTSLTNQAFKFKQKKNLVDRLQDQKKTARNKLTTAQQVLVDQAQQAIAIFWEQFGDFLPTHLVPASAVFRKRNFTGDNNNLNDYHTGAQNDPIPIRWYKAPNDYPNITYNGNNYSYTNNVSIGGVGFGVANANRPAIGGAFELKKVAHNQSRQNQQRFNKIFNDNNVRVGNTNAPALGANGGYDGDHVKDLGFNGLDRADNYWPLAANINRRAFNGYNSRYIINYKELDNGTMVGKARAIGGLIGKFFTVKAYTNQNVPAESNSEDAGKA